jgi:hypothetical protein
MRSESEKAAMTRRHFRFTELGGRKKALENNYIIEVAGQRHARDEDSTPQAYAAALKRARSIRERYDAEQSHD